jgi:hypothetical protein
MGDRVLSHLNALNTATYEQNYDKIKGYFHI